MDRAFLVAAVRSFRCFRSSFFLSLHDVVLTGGLLCFVLSFYSFFVVLFVGPYALFEPFHSDANYK